MSTTAQKFRATCREAIARAVENRRRTAEANGSWLTRDQCTQVVQMVKDLIPTSYVAAQFHVSDERVRQICRARGVNLRAIYHQRNSRARARLAAQPQAVNQ